MRKWITAMLRSLTTRAAFAFTRKKLPGWAIALTGLVQRASLWDEKVRFAYDAMRELGGEPEMIADILSWPGTGPVIVALGMAYIVFVGEPGTGVKRHVWWPYIGWSVFGLCSAAIIGSIAYGAGVLVQATSSLSDQQISAFTEGVKTRASLFNSGRILSVTSNCGASSRRVALQLAEAYRAAGLAAYYPIGDCSAAKVFNGTGIVIISEDAGHPSQKGLALAASLTAAHINWKWSATDMVPPGGGDIGIFVAD